MPEISEVLTPLQIQILLHYLEAEPSKRTVTDAAKCLGTTKWAVTRAMDTMEKLDIVERLENRKTVLTVKSWLRNTQNRKKCWSSTCSTRTSHPPRYKTMFCGH